VIDGYDEAPLCSSFASGSFDIDVIFHVHCTKPVWCVTAGRASPCEHHFFPQDVEQSTLAASESPLILNLHEVCLVLAKTNLTDLGVYEDTDDSAVFADMLK